ncbi:hypothetical protein CDL12_29745 [Handroanthus impetiginosus]|uniref:Bet v I/Major latex protein domain-containing protein n=1 Tax=Handroanthus impetiginosus TaxID=429701 RepID=A0A2G9FXY0_9LAMI|nr:hypothetical protein CDL12_29745 [Handroanthus impetiginosus]
MASLACKLVAQVAFKAGGDVFHHLLANKPQHLAKATPGFIQGCDLHQGNFGTNGSVVQWKYTLDGKEQTAKMAIQDIDKLYKNLLVTIHVETKDGVDFVTWTIEYELINPDNPHPLSLLNFYIDFTKQIETHIFGP